MGQSILVGMAKNQLEKLKSRMEKAVREAAEVPNAEEIDAAVSAENSLIEAYRELTNSNYGNDPFQVVTEKQVSEVNEAFEVIYGRTLAEPGATMEDLVDSLAAFLGDKNPA